MARRYLASARTDDGEIGGTRAALHLPGRVIPWDQVQSATWDADTETLTVTEVGVWGTPRPVHALILTAPGRLLELVRERVTASVLLERPFRYGRIVARRSPAGVRAVSWFVEYDASYSPSEPAVADASRTALASARAEVGE